MNRKDWRTVSVDDLDFNPVELVQQLLPTLHGNTIQIPCTPVEYGKRLVQECRQALSAVLPLRGFEREFLDNVLEKGEINPSLLAVDTALQERIQRQPLLEWKAINVRKYKGLD